jgi:hypothetical protein
MMAPSNIALPAHGAAQLKTQQWSMAIMSTLAFTVCFCRADRSASRRSDRPAAVAFSFKS